MTLAMQAQPAINIKALLWTIGVHLLLLLLFLILHYTIPKPVLDLGYGLEVNLGTSDNGSGNDQPRNHKNPSEYAADVVYKTVSTAQKTVSEHVYKDDHADATNVTNDKQKPGEATKPDSVQITPKEEKSKYLYPGAKGEGGNSAQDDKPGGSEGKTQGAGDQGVPNGKEGAPNYSGVPGNGGISHTLTGRKISPNKFEAEFNEGGRVVIHVTVDREGNIIDKFVKSSSSAKLTDIAMEKLSKAKFSKVTGAEPQQFGDVTFEFKTR